jgi:Asp-tRNA(Asn)/Glu-tRNA(Gln) amidotransferase A subunit family amidase
MESKMPKPQVRSFFSCAADFRSGRDTPRAFLDRCLRAIDEFEPVVGAFVHLDLAGAKEAAERSTERWRQHRPLSPIDGMPVGIKDIIETIDMPTQCGSPVYQGWWSGRDAASVTALRQAGAVIVGKTVTTEFATRVPAGTRNPWDPARTPGGSSSGSAAAVAAGMVSAALGTQVVGSILRPASFCGVVGFKPSVGAINRGGSHDGLSQSVHGPLAASLEDAWVVAREISNRAGGDPGYPGLYGPELPPEPARPKRLALMRTQGWPLTEPAAQAAFEAAVERLRGAGIEVLSRADDAALAALETALEQAAGLCEQILVWEGVWPLNTYRAKDASKLSDVALSRLAAGEAMTLDAYRLALAARERIRAMYAQLAGNYAAAITLSAPGPAPVGLHSTGNPQFNVPASLLGVPVLTLPVLSVDGLPLGLQAIGYSNQDGALFATAAWLRDFMQGAPNA